MSLTEFLRAVHELPRADKLRLIQLLAADVAREDGIAPDVGEKAAPIWSPHDAFEGAAALLHALDEDQGAP